MKDLLLLVVLVMQLLMLCVEKMRLIELGVLIVP